jgi:glycine amidinotransferase
VVAPSAQGSCPVSSYTEWDPLEEVIVGSLEGGCTMPWEPGLEAIVPEGVLDRVRAYHQRHAGKPFSDDELAQPRAELAEFVRVLEGEGVRVRRPDPVDHSKPYTTPDWSWPAGNAHSNPRDVLIVIGNEIIESNMSMRSRYFEYRAYRTLIKEYFRAGARWTAAPKSSMGDELYDARHVRGKGWVTTESEPAFDAADIARCGRDLFFQRSHASNNFAMEWLQRHLGDAYKVHPVEFADDRAIHIDATFVLLAPGKILVNPDRPIKSMPPMFQKAGWEVFESPRTTLPRSDATFKAYEWLHMNMLSLDEQRIIVEENEEPLIRFLADRGFEPIPVAFRNNYRHGGSFHCATVDIRRRGELRSYF